MSSEKAKEVLDESSVDFKSLMSPDIPEGEVEDELKELMSKLSL